MGRLLGICIKIFSDVFLIQELFKKIFNFRKLLYDCYTFLHKKIIHPSHISTKKIFKSRFFTLHLLQQLFLTYSCLGGQPQHCLEWNKPSQRKERVSFVVLFTCISLCSLVIMQVTEVGRVFGGREGYRTWLLVESVLVIWLPVFQSLHLA